LLISYKLFCLLELFTIRNVRKIVTRAQDEIVKSLRLTGREEGQEVRGPEEIGNGKAELNMF